MIFFWTGEECGNVGSMGMECNAMSNKEKGKFNALYR